ncbi:disks large-associated protein 5 isoform X2 [Nannospalax galili]|uniref:disks large-associated protein 5 isoform X2 n=1 Tax=Nannospalax galili TaxID=1026970 RepID=UPI00111C6D26|nr:disks large-associated protein 5 isoform X2 [Nannospalax galili]
MYGLQDQRPKTKWNTLRLIIEMLFEQSILGKDRRLKRKYWTKRKKVVQPIVSTSGRVTRSATQMTKEIARTVSSTTTRKPVMRAVHDNEPETKVPSKGRPGKKIDTKPDKVISSKVNDENTLDSQTSVTNGMDPDEVLSEMENVLKTNPAKMKRKVSFAPKDFVFQPLDGLKTYQVAPMTPRSASAFLTPSYDWNPVKPDDITQEATKEFLVRKSITYSTGTVQQDSNKLQCALDSAAVCGKEHGLNQKEATTKDSNCLSIKEVTSLEVNGQMSQPQHDVPYFRNILQSETDKLTSHCLEWDRKLDLDIPDDAKDLIRTAVGQTRLLIKERFKQFEGLVDDCEYKRGEKETTCTDLDGFWDMVSFQVEDVNQKFNNLVKLEQSGWQNNNNTSKKVFRKKIIPGISSKPKQDDGGRMAARNRLAAIKNAMKERHKQEEHTEAAAAERPKEVDKIVFDAGFFRVESPVKSFSVLSSERRSQRFGTPKSGSKVVPESRAKVDLLRQRISPENPDPQSNETEHIAKILFSNALKSRYRRVEEAQCPGLQDLIDINHDVNKINLKVDSLPSEIRSLPPLAGIPDDINTTQKAILHVLEGMDQNYSVTSKDVLMSSPEKDIPSQNSISQETAKTSLSVPFGKSLTTECYLLDSPGQSHSNPCPQVESRHQVHARNFSFGGDLIAFSPLRPLSREQPHC